MELPLKQKFCYVHEPMRPDETAIPRWETPSWPLTCGTAFFIRAAGPSWSLGSEELASRPSCFGRRKS
jgi:hypothetical protein